MTDARAFDTGRKSWTNWHHSVKQRIRGLYDLNNPDPPASSAGLRKTTAMIQGLLAEAKAADIRVRALGGGWSFSRAPATDGWMLNTKPLNWVFPISPGSLIPDRADDAERLFLVQCGNNISEINRYLEVEKGRSLRTTGASNGQTVAGAMSTGTHGSAIDFGAVQDHVLGLHLITAPDRHVWLEPASAPVVSQAFVDKLGAELVRDDGLFGAAIVAFGSIGVVHAVMIETVERFVLEAYRVRGDYDDGLKRAITAFDFDGAGLPDPSSRPYFFQVILNPHAGSKPATVTTMYKRPFPADHAIDYSISGGIGPGYCLLGPLGAITDTVPELTPLLVNQVAEIELAPFTEPRIGTLGETFDFTTPRTNASGAAIAVPRERAVEALALIDRVHDEIGPVPLIFACRFVRRSKGTLAFTRFESNCVFDIDGVASDRTNRFYRAIWRALAEAGIPHTQHWGKFNNLDAASVRRMYGSDADAWLTARRALLPDPADRRLFSSPFLVRLGLNE